MQGEYGYAIPCYFSEELLMSYFKKKDYGVKGVFFDQKPFILRRTGIYPVRNIYSRTFLHFKSH